MPNILGRVQRSSKQARKSQRVKINVGVLAIKDRNLSVKRGVTLPSSVSPKINSEDLLRKAVGKHNRFNNNLISSTHPSLYRLLYQYFDNFMYAMVSTDADVHLTSSHLQNEGVESENERLISCPVCGSLNPIQEIEEHADHFSMWLLDNTSEQSCDSPGVATSSINAENATTHQLTTQQQKKALMDQIATLAAQLLSTDTKRLTVT